MNRVIREGKQPKHISAPLQQIAWTSNFCHDVENSVHRIC